MSKPSWILKKLLLSLTAAYLCGGVVLALQSMSENPEPLWVMVLAPLMILREPLQFIPYHPVLALLWMLAFYALATFAYDQHDYLRKADLLQVQQVVRRLLVVLPVSYIAAGVILFLGNLILALGPSMIQVLIFGPGLLLLGPGQKIVEDPLVWGIVGVGWVYFLYRWLPASWGKRA